MRKSVRTLLTAALVSFTALGSAVTSYAGTWKQGSPPNETLWWYDLGNGSCAMNGWYWIDGNQDGTAECYYFNEVGWMLADTVTPDGYTVDSEGRWIQDGVLQTKAAQDTAPQASASQDSSPQETTPQQPAEETVVPLASLPSLASIRKRCTDEEMVQAYNAALEIVTPLLGKSEEDKMVGVTNGLRRILEENLMYSMTEEHYNDPYGYLVKGAASCAGCTRTTIMCLEMLGFTSVEHVNPNQYTHQWARVKMSDGRYAICDAFGLYCGIEPAPYAHPYF